MEKVRVHLIIEGRVQGVWFRESTRKKALSLGVCGWVRNLVDGTVEVVAEVNKDKVEELVRWCHKGPPAAEVTNVKRKQEEYLGEFDDFSVVYLY
ncbi:MAG: acylphosphatase [Deltaproteobacteria bacterium]|nr:MAG: acylphosphatase [Deltaproteobacteria bacterium]